MNSTDEKSSSKLEKNPAGYFKLENWKNQVQIDRGFVYYQRSLVWSTYIVVGAKAKARKALGVKKSFSKVMAYLSILTSFVPELCLWRRPPVKILWRLFSYKKKAITATIWGIFLWILLTYWFRFFVMSQAEMMMILTFLLQQGLGYHRCQGCLAPAEFLDSTV